MFFCRLSDCLDSRLMSSPSRVRYTQPDPAGGDVPAHSMVLEWLGNPSHVVGDSLHP